MAFFNRRELGWVLGYLGASFGAAGLGALITAQSVDSWYRTLRKPAWTPPDAAFGPVWTLLYVLIGIAGWIVRREALRDPALAAAAAAANRAWLAQLLLNVGWSAVFFGLRRTGWGLAVIVALWSTIAACAALSARVSRLSAALLLPYLGWTGFAAALNGRIWQLNRGRWRNGLR
jgi:translocator protein